MIPLNRLAEIIDDKKGFDVVALDVEEICSFTDTFLIASTRNYIQIEAIAAAILDEYKQQGLPMPKLQGTSRSGWVLLDCDSVIIHLFSETARGHYNIEKLWANAKPLELGISS